VNTILSYVFYYIGHVFSYFMLATGLGYGFYSKMMSISCDLDQNEVIWKRVKQRRKYRRKS
jgi:hypothetical protein